MKILHVLSLFFLVIGGLHFVLHGFGVDLIGAVFGSGVHMMTLYILIGLSTLYHGVPMLTTKLSAL